MKAGGCTWRQNESFSKGIRFALKEYSEIRRQGEFVRMSGFHRQVYTNGRSAIRTRRFLAKYGIFLKVFICKACKKVHAERRDAELEIGRLDHA